MTAWPLIAGMALVTYLTRVGGLWLAASVPPAVARSLRLVPVAVFAALAAPALPGATASETAARVLAAGAGAASARLSRRVWVGIGVGMLGLWMMR